MYTKTWNDQPNEVEQAEIKLQFGSDGKTIEVRAKEEPDISDETKRWINRTFYVTIGNLFGSETLVAYGVDALFACLNVCTTNKPPIKIPSGCKLILNEKRT